MINFKELLKDLRDTEESLKEFFMRFVSIRYLIIAAVHFFLTFYSDKFIFEYENANLFFIVRTKLIFFIVLAIIWHFIGYITQNYLKSCVIRTFIKFSCIYFSIMMIFQFALWPFIVGNQMYYGYLNDSIHLTNTAVFQGTFIRYFRIYTFMLVPHIAGIIIVQLIIISMIIGFVMQKIKDYFKLNKAIYFFYIPFLSPLIIQFNLHMEKDIMYGYSLFFLIAFLLFTELNKSPERLNKNLVFIAFLSAVVASIRPGGIFFFAATPVIVYFLNNKYINFQKIVLFIFLNIAMSFIFIPNIVSTVVLDKNGESYKNVYILNNTFKILLEEAIEEDNEYIMDEFDLDTNLKPERLLSDRTVLSDGFFSSLPKKDKDKFKIISKKLMEEYFYQYIEYKFKKMPKKLRIIDLNPNPHDIVKYDIYAYNSYTPIKDKIVQINPYIYAKVINFFRTYNKYLVYPNYVLIVLIISIYCIAFFCSVFFRIRKVFIVTSISILYIIFQILIIPYAGFRFFFPIYLIGYLLILYLFFYFISHKKISGTDCGISGVQNGRKYL